MKTTVKNIIFVVIVVLITASITTYAVFSTSAEHITLNIDKTDKDNVKDSLNELYDMAGGSGCPEDKACLDKSNETKKCIRATSLHIEKCTQTDTTAYCSSTNTSDNGSDIKNGDTIIYGSYGTSGTLTAGDAFTCDVNGDGYYDEIKERFYYVSDLYTGGETGSETFDTNYAVLIYYNNTTNGVAGNTNTSLIAYHSIGDNNLGPVTAVANLPTTNQWSNMSLKNQTKQIYNQNGTTTTGNGTRTIFPYTYTDKAARLITSQEIRQACGTSTYMSMGGYLDTPTCRFLLENIQYSNSSTGTNGYWIETPLANSSYVVWYVNGPGRWVTTSNVDDTSKNGVRPVIEVLKTDIAY